MPETESPPRYVTDDLPVRIRRWEDRFPDIHTGQPTVRVHEVLECTIETLNPAANNAPVTMQLPVDIKSSAGQVLKQCVEMYDELRKRYAEVVAERDALKAAKKGGKS